MSQGVAGAYVGLGLSLVLAGLAGCSGGRSLICGSDALYRDATSQGPLRVPDDLSVPDETESLRIPDSQAPAADPGQPVECLEATPATS